MQTIYALSSGSLPCAIAIIRISGNETKNIVKNIVGSIGKPRVMTYASFKNHKNEIIDYGMYVYFSSPQSFTGEDCAEFHLHGSKAVVSAFLLELSLYKNTRQAQAGEFSRRAYVNGKIDLLQAEALADLLEAESESQRRLSILGASKQTTILYNSWRNSLIEAMALLEATLDFSEEEDIVNIDNNITWLKIETLIKQLKQHLSLVTMGNIMQNGLKITIVGAPNAGKSSLLNILSGRDLAIVTAQAGTTRDVIEAKLNIQGVDIFLFDTAGLRETEDEVEKLGIVKALNYIDQSDLIFYMHDSTSLDEILLPETNIPIWFINSKIDKTAALSKKPARCKKIFSISTMQPQTIAVLVQAIENYLLENLPKYGTIIPAKQRHISLLNKSLTALITGYEDKNILPEIKAEYLRIAANYLGQITGEIGVENILDVIFSQFCIGK